VRGGQAHSPASAGGVGLRPARVVDAVRNAGNFFIYYGIRDAASAGAGHRGCGCRWGASHSFGQC
jgi:hypothetical protein